MGVVRPESVNWLQKVWKPAKNKQSQANSTAFLTGCHTLGNFLPSFSAASYTASTAGTEERR